MGVLAYIYTRTYVHKHTVYVRTYVHAVLIQLILIIHSYNDAWYIDVIMYHIQFIWGYNQMPWLTHVTACTDHDAMYLLNFGGLEVTLLSLTLNTVMAILPPNTNMMMMNAQNNPMSCRECIHACMWDVMIIIKVVIYTYTQCTHINVHIHTYIHKDVHLDAHIHTHTHTLYLYKWADHSCSETA